MKALDLQVFTLSNDGGLSYTEAMGMTNDKRKRWLQIMEARAKKQQEAAAKARSAKSPKTGPR